MDVTVIIPVGPRHERYAEEAARSVRAAWEVSRGPFTALRIVTVPDGRGRLGRSRARNLGLDQNPSAWHFLLDADDEMMPGAFALVDLEQPATFGAVCLRLKGVTSVYAFDVYPVTRDTLFAHGPHGTLTMGFFLRGDLGLRFNETMDLAEDFDFYMRLPGFTKQKDPLVQIGYDAPSSSGPRGSDDPKIQWLQACQSVIDRYRPVVHV